MFGTTMTAEEAIYKEECRQAEINYLEQREVEAHYVEQALQEELAMQGYYVEMEKADEEIRLLMTASHDWGHLKGLI